MKKIFIILSIIVFLFSCGTNSDDNNFKVKGKIINAADKILYISEFSDFGFINVDSVIIDKNGNFELGGSTSIPNFYALRIAPNEFITLLIDSADVLNFTSDADNFTTKYKITGSESMELMNNLNNKLANTHAKIDSLSRIFMLNEGKNNIDSIRENLDIEFDNISKSQKQFSTKFIKDNINSLACLIALEQNITSRKPVFTLQNDLDIFLSVDSSLSILYPKSNHVKLLHKVISNFKNKKKLQSNSTIKFKIGDILPDLSLKNPSGKLVSLYSLRGKYVLVDFWAAWCQPCRQANNKLKSVYNEYKNKNFTIYQISLDKEKQMWTGAIKHDSISDWYHVSDLLFWESKAAKLYGINQIPFNYLLDPKGKIIAINLHGNELQKELKRLSL